MTTNNNSNENSLVMETLLQIKEQIGAIRSDIYSMTKSLDKHAEEDKEFQKNIHERLKALEDYKNRFAWTISLIGTLVVFGIEVLKSYFFGHK